MIKEIKELFNEEVLYEASKRYGVSSEHVKSIGGYESFVYQYEREEKSYILKITHEIRRSVDYIMGELEWINFLSDSGISVCQCIPSLNGHLVEVIPYRNSNFLAISYEKANGRRVEERNWNEKLFEIWGELVGKIHSVTKNYELSDPKFKRQEWFEEEQLRSKKYLLPSDQGVIDFIESKIETLKNLPTTKDSYGLVHSDFHQKNFFLHNQTIHLYDFDDIGYHYFISDIGIVFYYALGYPVKKQEDIREYVQTFYQHFMEGYEKHNHLDSFWFQYLPDFINLRHALAYVGFHQTRNVEKLDSRGLLLLDQHRQEVLNGFKVAEVIREFI